MFSQQLIARDFALAFEGRRRRVHFDREARPLLLHGKTKRAFNADITTSAAQKVVRGRSGRGNFWKLSFAIWLADTYTGLSTTSLNEVAGGVSDWWRAQSLGLSRRWFGDWPLSEAFSPSLSTSQPCGEKFC